MEKQIKEIQSKTKKMTDEELRQEIVKLNQKQIEDIGQITFYEIFYKSLELENVFEENKKVIEELEKDGLEILNLYEKIQEKIKNIDIIVNLNDIEDELKIDCFKSLRKEAIDLIEGLSCYLTELSYSNELAHILVMKDKYRSDNKYKYLNINLEEFYRNIYNFLVEDINTLYPKASRIINVVPFRISKNKFYDLVKQTLTRELKQFSKKKANLIIDRYKSIFNGALDLKYGQKFSELFTQAQKAKNFDFKNSSIEEIENIYELTTNYIFKIHNLINLITECGLIINRLIIISKMLEHYNTFKIEEVKKFIQIWKGYIINKDVKNKNNIQDICEENIDTIKKRMNESNINFQAITNEYHRRNKRVDKELNNLLIKTQNVLALYNDTYLEKEEMLIVNDIEKVDLDYLEQAIDNFIQFINRNIKDMGNMQRKVRMKKLLAALNKPFIGPEEFFQYIKNSMELNTKREDIIYSIEQVSSIIQEYKKNKLT
ncbi:hypothetical protein [Caldisalinibacter kiritimatiensis]|nr:hypothetical protein [Caldisalinibacter kiritimatiensis]